MNRAAWVLLALAGVTLAGLYWWARPETAPPRPAPPPADTTAPPVAPADEAARFSFEIAGGKVIGPPVLAATAGQRITLRVRSDVADELHVHGYDLSAPLPAGEEVALTFVASRSGRFEVELHGSHRELGALEVRPR